MMRRNFGRALIGAWLVGLGLATTRPGVADSGMTGRALAASCASCHLRAGDASGVPAILGLDESRIVHLMLGFRADAHSSQIMHVVADALSPEEIAQIAHYLAAQRSHPHG